MRFGNSKREGEREREREKSEERGIFGIFFLKSPKKKSKKKLFFLKIRKQNIKKESF